VADSRVKSPVPVRSPSLDVRLESAVACAMAAADRIGLPQTVYRDADSGGWWHTNSLAPRLERAELHATYLPANYFT